MNIKDFVKKYGKEYNWLLEAKTEGAEISMDEDKKVIWHNGTWKDGIWHNGTWKDGIWHNGKWKDGVWKNGKWKDGVWKNGKWENGTWIYGLWINGVWKNGIWNRGFWYNGSWNKGIWKEGDWYRGNWKDGIWKNGIWYDGTPLKGKFESIWIKYGFCKWSCFYNKSLKQLKIGCKTKTVKEWKKWLEGIGKYETKRDSEEFRMIEETIKIGIKILS